MSGRHTQFASKRESEQQAFPCGLTLRYLSTAFDRLNYGKLECELRRRAGHLQREKG